MTPSTEGTYCGVPFKYGFKTWVKIAAASERGDSLGEAWTQARCHNVQDPTLMLWFVIVYIFPCVCGKIYPTLEKPPTKASRKQERSPRSCQEECEWKAARLRMRLTRACKRSQEARPDSSLIESSRQNQLPALPETEQLLPQYQTEMLRKSGSGHMENLDVVLNHLQDFPDTTKKEEMCMYQGNPTPPPPKEVSLWKWPGRNSGTLVYHSLASGNGHSLCCCDKHRWV